MRKRDRGEEGGKGERGRQEKEKVGKEGGEESVAPGMNYDFTMGVCG